MAADLDALDLKILTHLLRDGRAPAQQVADAVGLSRPAVADRIARLEREGVIRGHHRRRRAVRARPRRHRVRRRARPDARRETEESFDALLKSDEIVEAHTVAGDDCFLIKVRTDSITSLNALVSKLTAPPLSLATRTTIVMQTHCEKVGGITLGEQSE